MLEYAWIRVAMQNGIDELKQVATHKTETNENERVAAFLEHYFNLK